MKHTHQKNMTFFYLFISDLKLIFCQKICDNSKHLLGHIFKIIYNPFLMYNIYTHKLHCA